MARKATIHSHAIYLPRPPLPRPAARSHATPVAQPSSPRPVVHRRARLGMSGSTTGRGPRSMSREAVPRLCAGALLVTVLGATFLGLVLGLFTLLREAQHAPGGAALFPLLLGGTILILVRGQVSAERYQFVRQRIGLAGGHWSDHVLGLLYVLTLFFAVAVVATLLSWGAAMVISASGI